MSSVWSQYNQNFSLLDFLNVSHISQVIIKADVETSLMLNCVQKVFSLFCLETEMIYNQSEDVKMMFEII